MSMKDYAFTDYGLVLNDLVDDELLMELAEDEKVDFQFSFTGEAFPLSDDGNPEWSHGESFDDNTVYYISAKCPRLFEAVYADMKSMVADVLKKYRNVKRSDRRLPRLTEKQVREHLRSIQGTYFG